MLVLLLHCLDSQPFGFACFALHRVLELRHAASNQQQRGEQDEPDYSGGQGTGRAGWLQQGEADVCSHHPRDNVLREHIPRPSTFGRCQSCCSACSPHPGVRAADIPNLPALRNPGAISPVELPLTLCMLAHVPILVSSRRSQTSGSPTHVVAKLWLKPAPGCGEERQAAPPLAGSQAEQAGLREALAPGIQENWD